MKNILITGATGHVGRSTICHYFTSHRPHRITAAVRDVKKAQELFADFNKLNFVLFDFMDPATYDEALKGVDTVFLIRPPQISDAERIFRPFIRKMKAHGVREVCFLSVQGANKSRVIPHNRIENLIEEYEFQYIFLRPGYFMQNLTSALLADIRDRNKIVLPAKNVVFNWIDAENIGECAAICLDNFSDYCGRAYDITGYENYSFKTVAEKLSNCLDKQIRYQNVGPVSYFRYKRSQGEKRTYIMVKMILHMLPRMQKPPEISDFYRQLTGRRPTELMEFIQREKKLFIG